mmetsp:Transcript_127686/g.272252  ORF Transcript_127686/g.272252 Transcript_127686/m.272252 type:complete len:326 (-) Transcript_127686:56-1033(-)
MAAPQGAGSSIDKRKGGSKGLRALYRTPSHQSQLELNDIPDFANEPGPGHYFGPGSIGFSAIGKQRFSKNMSAPELSFPRTNWNKWEGVIISKGHQGTAFCKETTKIKNSYELPEGLSHITTKMGSSLRPDVSMMMGCDPKGSPGPNINLREVPSTVIGEVPGRPTRQSKTFGMADRFAGSKPGGIGPGEYPRKDTAIKVGGGKSIGVGRACYEKVITPGWEDYGKCRANDKGPGLQDNYDIKLHGSHANAIGKGQRFAEGKRAPGPGPGAYDQSERGVSKLKQVCSDSLSPPQAHFGTQPKKPRFRPILAKNIDGAKHGSWGYH